MPIVNRIAAFHDEMTAWRRDLHQHPETAFEEFRTAGIVADKLKSWGIEVHTGIATTGVVGVLHGTKGSGGKAIGLRADMDALNIFEANDVPYKSVNEGKMHACGHDGHTTMLLGAAKYLAENRNFDGTVYFFFQPAEEMGGGAKVMMDEGLFTRFPVETVWGMHNWPELPAGKLALREGPTMAAADVFQIKVLGKGAHGAYPHQGIDPVMIGSQIVSGLQTVVSRNANPIDTAVVSVTQFHAGHADNVIPGEAVLSGTVRTFRPETRDMVEDGMKRLATSIAEAFGATAEVNYKRSYPALVNSPAETDFAETVAAEIVGQENVIRVEEPTMGAEDFAFMLEEKPGSYIFIGGAGGPSTSMVHNPTYDFNDAILPIGSSYFVKLVEKALPRR